jgi:1,4-dihydroxy-2-naphthoyl-CoA hydrolase
MYDTDMAGVIFFARQFYYIHEAIEELFDKAGIPFTSLFSTSDFVFVIVHAEADYYKPLSVGDPLIIQTTLGEVGTTSVALNFTIYRNEELVGNAKTIQVCLKAKDRAKTPIPDHFLKKLKEILNN